MKNAAVAVVAAVTVVVAVFVVAAVVIPLLVLLRAVADGDTLPRLFTAANVAALGETLRIGVGSVVVAVGIGVPIAVAVERTDIGGARALGALAVLPLAVPSYLLAFAFRAAFDDRIGVFAAIAGIVGDVDSVGGIVVVLGTALLPIVVVRLRATLRTIDGALEEAARIAGAGPLRALLDVTLRMSAPTVVSSAVLVFAGATAAFGVPLLLGLGAKTPIVVVTTRITLALQSGAPGAVADALALSVALAIVSTSAFAVAAVLTRGTRVAAGRVARPTRLQLGAWRAPSTILAWAVVVVLVVVPLASLIVQGLTLHAGHGLRFDNLGVTHLVDVIGRADVRRAAGNSALLAIAAAAIIVVVSVIVVVTRRRA
ncbi:MAG TPA: ABC transporter permease subunit, partial [Myxococcota bacterium]